MRRKDSERISVACTCKHRHGMYLVSGAWLGLFVDKILTNLNLISYLKNVQYSRYIL